MANRDSMLLVTRFGTSPIEIPGLPPGQGEAAIPHAATFLAMLPGGISRVFRPGDEALRESRENARYMRNDPVVMECLEIRKRATALLDWRIEADQEDDPIRDELTKILKRIPRFVQYRETLLDALWYGRYAVENVLAWDFWEGRKRVVVKGWAPIHGDKLVWRMDSATGRWDAEEWGIRVGVLSGLSEKLRQWYDVHRQYIESTDWGMAYFPPPEVRQTVVIHRHMVEDGEYEEPANADRIFGVGIRSRIYWAWYQKQQALRWLMEFLERSAFGIELWYYPSGNPQARQEMLEAAQERVGTGKNILLVPRPPGGEGMVYGVERIEPSMAGAQALKDILTEYFGHQIKRYILGQTLTTEAQATGLGSNLASIHLDTFLQIVRYDAQNLQETLTEQLVWRLVRWNWPGIDPRQYRLVIEVDRPDISERLGAIRQAWEMGLKIRSADLRDLVGVAEPAEEEEFLQNPAYSSGERSAESGEPNSPPSALRSLPPAERYSLPEGPREGQRRTSPAGSEQVFHEHRWHNVPQSESTVFASPNVGPGMSLGEARRRLRSQEHHRVKQVFWEIARGEGLEPKQAHDAIGMWLGGAENSILLEFGPVPWDKLLLAAAKMGLAARQEGVAVFQEDPQDIYGRWTASFAGSAEELSGPLVEHGITNWTIVESKGAVAVVVCDHRESLQGVADDLSRVLRPVRSVLVPGRFELISGDTRTEAAQIFREIINSSKQEREQMAAEEKKPWFLRDLKNASPKVRAWAEIMRRGYEFRQLPIEEQKRRLAAADEALRRMGILFERQTGLSTIEGAGQASDASPDPSGQPTTDQQGPQ